MAESNSHQLVMHYDPARPEWVAATCSCGRWTFECTGRPDPASHIMTSSLRAEKEWRRHTAGRGGGRD